MKKSNFLCLAILLIYGVCPISIDAQEARFAVKAKDGTVNVRDFRATAEKLSPDSFYVNGKYCNFVFDKKEQRFSVLLLLPNKKSSLSAVQQQCETNLLKDLGISQADACRLNLSISAPRATNPYHSNLWGRDTVLSFCNKQTKKSLPVKRGEVQISAIGTKNGACQTVGGYIDAVIEGRTVSIDFDWLKFSLYRDGKKVASDREAEILCPDIPGKYKVAGKQIDAVGKWRKPNQFEARSIYIH